MSHIAVVGAGIAGTSAAFELNHKLRKAHRITLINLDASFRFVPSNPWVAVGWREGSEIAAKPQLARAGIDFIGEPVERLEATGTKQ